ncbi:maltokinase, partial [Mycobacterium sp. ITM-2017-0098]
AERYQVLVRWADRPLAGYPEAAVIGSVTGPDGERVAYDALYDPEAARHLLSLIDSSATVGDLRFSREPGVTLPVDAPPKVSGA